MAESHVTNALKTRRAALVAEAEDCQAALRRLTTEIDAIDITLRALDPEIDLDKIRLKATPRYHVSFRGELVRAAMSILRQAKMPLASKDIALRIMADRGMNIGDPGAVAVFRRNVHACLSN